MTDDNVSDEVVRYRLHLLRLADEHHIEIDLHAGPRHLAASAPDDRRVLLPDVTDDTGYAVALHEFGHIISPAGHANIPGECCRSNKPATCTCGKPFPTLMETFDVLNAEVAAWDWARANALEWTVGMEQTRHWATETYVQWTVVTRARVGF